MKSPLTIAFATNGLYVPLALCCLTSMLLHASRRNNLRFVLLSDGLLEGEIALFHQALKVFHCDPDQLEVFPLKERLEKMELPLWNGNKSAWLRLLLPELLPEVSHVIYTDVDTLWLCDVQTFVPWMEIKTAIAWCRASSLTASIPNDLRQALLRPEEIWFSQNGERFDPRTYPNTGILVLNLGKLRVEDFTEKWIGFLKTHPNPTCPDQDTLYCLLKDDVTVLPMCYNWLSLTPGIPTPIPGILHYAGRPNPWRADGNTTMAPHDDLLLFRAFWEQVMAPLYGEALHPYAWDTHMRNWWQERWWPALQRRFPWLYAVVHHRLIQRAKTSEAKARKLSIFFWHVWWHTNITLIPWSTRKRLYRQWSHLLQDLTSESKEKTK